MRYKKQKCMLKFKLHLNTVLLKRIILAMVDNHNGGIIDSNNGNRDHDGKEKPQL